MPWESMLAKNLALRSIFGDDRHDDAPAIWYFALLYHPTNPETVLGTEPTIGVGSYARVAKNNDNSLWTITDDYMENDVEIRWPLSSAPWSEEAVNQWAIFDAATGGEAWAFDGIEIEGELGEIETNVAGRQPVVPEVALVITQGA